MSQPDSASMPQTDEPKVDQTSEEVLQPPVAPFQPSLKPYCPPKPDSFTFPTQRAFLDSLQPISIEEVEVNDRRCAICWKPYGEIADPGYDNTEAPVKLHCGHIYGDKCLAFTFRTPETNRHSLKPLSFDTDSAKGCILGQKIHAFITTHSTTDALEHIDTMLIIAGCGQRGNELFGEYWWSILQVVAQLEVSLTNVTLMDNALILDHNTKPWPNSSLLEDNQSLTEAQMAGLLQLSDWQPQLSPTLNIGDLLPTVYGPAPTAPLMWQLITASPQAEPHSVTSVLSATMSAAQSGSTTAKTWQETIANTTNLGNLSALQKMKSTTGEHEATEQGEPVKKKQAAMQLAADQARAAQEHLHRHNQEMRMLRSSRNRSLLARKLSDVYFEYYERLQKKVNLCEDTDSSSPAQSYWTSISVHTRANQGFSYQISPPLELQGNEDIETEVDLSKAIVILTRSNCRHCNPTEKLSPKVLRPVPTELWWRQLVKGPDDCPLCHRILYLRERPFY